MPVGQGHFTQNGWGESPKNRDQNEDRRRWYGTRPGDIVEWPAMGLAAAIPNLKVVRLHATDNNGCTVTDGKREFKCTCEHLRITRKVEDAPQD